MSASEQAEAVTTAPPMSEAAAPPLPAPALRPRDWLRLVQGFYFVFFGLVGTLATLIEMFLMPTTRLLPALVSGATVLATLTGAWRLFQVKHLSTDWQHRTRDLLIGAAGLVYFWPFFQMWLRLSDSMYLLGNALAYAGLCFYGATLLSLVVAAMTRALGLKALHTQAVVFGAIAFVTVFLPFVLFAIRLVLEAQAGNDPLLAAQEILHHTPMFLLLILLFPASLAFSLAWAGKDLALRQLLGDRP